MYNSLQPHEPQHARPPCASPTPGIHPNPYPLGLWCHSIISSFVVPFSSCPQSFATLGSFSVSRLFTPNRVANGLTFHLGWQWTMAWALPPGRGKENLSLVFPQNTHLVPLGLQGYIREFFFFFPDHTPGMSSITCLCDPVPGIWWRNSRETNGDYMEINHTQLVFSAGNCSVLFPFHFSPHSLGSAPLRAWHQLDLCD